LESGFRISKSVFRIAGSYENRDYVKGIGFFRGYKPLSGKDLGYLNALGLDPHPNLSVYRSRPDL